MSFFRRSQYSHIFTFLLGGFLLFCTTLGCFASGFIQINTDEGVQVHLDGKLVGTVGKNGMVISDVSVGAHEVLLTKKGFQPVRKTVNVRDGDVELIKHLSLTPTTRVRVEGEASQEAAMAKVGILRIRTIPVECTINILGLGLPPQKKARSDAVFDPIMAGKHKVEITPASGAKKIRLEATVYEDEESIYLVNLSNGSVRDLAAETREAKKKQEEAEKREAERLAMIERQKQLEMERKARFEREYRAYQRALDRTDLSVLDKGAMWKALCKRWGVDHTQGISLKWENSKVVIAQ